MKTVTILTIIFGYVRLFYLDFVQGYPIQSYLTLLRHLIYLTDGGYKNQFKCHLGRFN